MQRQVEFRLETFGFEFYNLDGALKLIVAMQEPQVETLESQYSREQILILMLHVLLILNYSMQAQKSM